MLLQNGPTDHGSWISYWRMCVDELKLILHLNPSSHSFKKKHVICDSRLSPQPIIPPSPSYPHARSMQEHKQKYVKLVFNLEYKHISQPPKYAKFIVNSFNYININVTKNRSVIPMDFLRSYIFNQQTFIMACNVMLNMARETHVDKNRGHRPKFFHDWGLWAIFIAWQAVIKPIIKCSLYDSTHLFPRKCKKW